MTAARNSQNLVARLRTNAHLKKDIYATWEEAADEIERLRAELDTARLDERAKIVAWLRKEAQVLIDQSDFNEGYCRANLWAATDIEAGEHLK